MEISSLLGQEVIGHHAELQTGTATHKHYAVAFGDAEQFFEKRLGFVHHGLKLFRAVADFHKRETHTAEIHTSLGSGFNHFLREN